MKTKFSFGLLACVCIFGLQLTPVQAQNTMFTYQGRVTANGANFTGAGQFEFALVTSTNFSSQATATANPPSGGFITVINVTVPGSGYTTAPAVTITGGGGSNATAQATVSGGIVTGVTVQSPGMGYSSTPIVTIAPPPANLLFTTFWSNDGTSVAGSEPAQAISVNVAGGIFTIVIGDTTIPNMAALPASVFTQANLQLRIWFNDGFNGFAVLSPPQNLTPTPYAVQALNAATAVSANSVAASNVLGQLANAQLPGGVVTNNENGINLVGSFTGNGNALTNLSANNLVTTGTNDSITAWGPNNGGNLSFPPGLINVKGVAIGSVHALAIKADGSVIAWGAGTNYNPGDGSDFGQAIVPVTLTNAVAVSAGNLHSVALKPDGTVVAWGEGTNYNPTVENYAYGQAMVPTGLSNVVAISAGAVHTLALLTNGTVVAWGAGKTGQTNAYDVGQSIVPGGLNNVTAISAGFLHSMALKSDGTVVAWGANIPNFNAGQTTVPSGLNQVTAIAAGGLHSLALKSNGTVVAWGAGTILNPGDGSDFGQSIVPPGLSNVIAIAAGIYQSLALKADGTVVGWGNPITSATVPTNLDNIIALAPGSTALGELALRRRASAPVAWLDSDNTFNGNIQVNGQVSTSSGIRLNDMDLLLRSGSDLNSGLGWYGGTTKTFGNTSPDGPVLYGYGGGTLGTTSNGQNAALTWDASNHVGIGTSTPSARLSLGSDGLNSKLLLLDGFNPIGFGAQSGQMILHLGGAAGGEFSFFDFPGGNELARLTSFGFLGIGTNAPRARLDVRGGISLGSSSQYFAMGSQNSLRVVRGVISSTGGILGGEGFTVSRTAVGSYTVTFTVPFTDSPAIIATPQVGTAHFITSTSDSVSSAQFRVWAPDSTLGDIQFHFIAIGEQ